MFVVRCFNMRTAKAQLTPARQQPDIYEPSILRSDGRDQMQGDLFITLTLRSKLLAKLPMLLANHAVGKAVVPFANRTLPTTVASRLAKVTTAELTASPFANGTRGCWRSFPNRARVPVGEELFPIT
jgi:hypothetical protein